MKFFIAILLTALLAYAAFLFFDVLPWWSIAIGSALVGVAIPQKPWRSWICGFLGVFICWFLLAWKMDAANGSLLSAKMANVLPLKGSAIGLIFLSAFVGGLVSSFAALAGTFLRKQAP